MSEYFKLKSGQTEQFILLKEKYRTSKYIHHDVGLALIVFSILSFLTYRYRIKYNEIILRSNLYALGLFTVTFTIFSEIAVIFRDYNRGEYPHWADSLGIPIFQLLILGIIMIIWVIIHNYLYTKTERKLIKLSISNRIFLISPWILFISLITVVLSFFCIYEGNYLTEMSCFFWISYYANLNKQIKEKWNKLIT
ncbi:hypothetical protein [Leptospira vanthielii]|uniref:Uncharacterized protein n=1 Tax=Leptospira vanthielii TaxID=293085 RepID=A0ABY2NUK5_9LEPT|nr:hypothetical protein [Leptospira vanthielii]TGM61737.1 hypothetical protein EHQ95_00365 [Leptospira vanthielii]